MKYTKCETLMWHALTPTLFRWLREQKPGWNNSLWVCLSAGMVRPSVYEAADEKNSKWDRQKQSGLGGKKR